LANEEVPQRILDFLHRYIDSVELLSVLLYLHSNPEMARTTTEITIELRSAETSISKRLDDLYSRGVLNLNDDDKRNHQFSPSSPELKTVIGELDELYRLKPYKVIDAIYSRPRKSIQEFADAFKLRGEKS
jgi:hypothetical protein